MLDSKHDNNIRDLELALASLSYISSPLDVGEVEILKQRATDIQRCGGQRNS